LTFAAESPDITPEMGEYSAPMDALAAAAETQDLNLVSGAVLPLAGLTVLTAAEFLAVRLSWQQVAMDPLSILAVAENLRVIALTRDRVILVPAESRTFTVPAQDRTFVVAGEN
jgi:hypothetical protein